MTRKKKLNKNFVITEKEQAFQKKKKNRDTEA